MKIKKECFYDVDEWLLETHPELLEDSETHYLANQLKLARESLVKKLEGIESDTDTLPLQELTYTKGYHFCTKDFDKDMLNMSIPYKYYWEDRELDCDHSWLYFDASNKTSTAGFYTCNYFPELDEDILSKEDFIKCINTMGINYES